MNSALPRIVHPVASEAARSLMRGVRPIAATTSRTGFIEVLWVESAKGRRQRVLRQASALATRRRVDGARRSVFFIRLENTLDGRVADQPFVVRRADWHLALLRPTRPLRPRPCLDGDPRSACGRDPAGRHGADRAVGRPLPHSLARSGGARRGLSCSAGPSTTSPAPLAARQYSTKGASGSRRPSFSPSVIPKRASSIPVGRLRSFPAPRQPRRFGRASS